MPSLLQCCRLATALIIAGSMFMLPAFCVAETLRYVGRYVDGTTVQGRTLTERQAGPSDPQLDGKPLATADKPLRWLRDRSRTSSGPPLAMIELIGGDRFPGTVVDFRPKIDSAGGTIPAHFIVEPSIVTGRPGNTTVKPVHVLSSFVRRIIWKSGTGTASLRPNTLLLRNGRRVAYRSIRFSKGELSMLTDGGPLRFTYDEVARCRLATRDPWLTYYDELTALCPNGPDRLTQIETTEGMIATVSKDRLFVNGGGEVTRLWYTLAPAWLIDPIWVIGAKIVARRAFKADLIPLSRLAPETTARGGVPPRWRANRDAYGGRLVSNRTEHCWGFGVHGRVSLSFPTSPLVRAIRGSVGLDSEAGPGGCVRARIFSGSTAKKPLYESPYLIGSQSVVDLGRIALPSTDTGGTLILQMDEAHVGRPRGADPFDVRDIANWLDPRLELDTVRLAAEIKNRRAEAVGAWKGWQVKFDSNGKYHWHTTLSSAPRSAPARLVRGLHVGGAPLRLHREVRIDDQTRWLALLVRRAEAIEGETVPEIEVRVDDQVIGKRNIPVGDSASIDPMVFDLAAYHGKNVRLEILQRPTADGTPPVGWDAVMLGYETPNLRLLLEDDAELVSFPKGDDVRARLVKTDKFTGTRSVQVMSGGRVTIKLRKPVIVRANPKHGEQRYLQFAVRKSGGGRICLELGTGDKDGKVLARYDAGVATKARPRKDRVWFDDELPPGAVPSSRGLKSQWKWVSGAGNRVFSGKRSQLRKSPDFSQHYFAGANPPLELNAGDKLFIYVYLDPKDPPRQLLLELNDGLRWEHRAYWGENLIKHGVEGTISRRAMGPLPERGKWVRLEVDAADIGFRPGSSLHGWACTQFGGTVWWDKAGVNGTGKPIYGHARRAWQFELPDEWVVVTRDLVAEVGEGEISELTLHVPDGEHALFDHVYMARRVTDLSLVAPVDSAQISDAAAIRRLAPEAISRGLPATVTVEVDGRRATGVVVGEDGHVLTAGHMLIGDKKDTIVTLADGHKLKGRTLGICKDLDCGLVKLTDPFPGRGVQLGEEDAKAFSVASLYVALSKTEDTQHSKRPLPYVVQLRGHMEKTFWTVPDLRNPAVAGPLLGRSGKMLGMYARPTINRQGHLYIKASAIQEAWPRLVAGETWGNWLVGAGPMLGVVVTSTHRGAIVTKVYPDSPAVAQGIMLGDHIRKVNGKWVGNLLEVYKELASHDPGDEVTLELRRSKVREQKVKLIHRTVQ
jgi:S1-C subfamily serine protease